MSKNIIIRAEFASIDQAERVVLALKEECRQLQNIKLLQPRQANRKPPAMSALFINYGFSQNDPKGTEFNNPAYPPFLFRSRWESIEEGKKSDIFSKDSCRMEVVAQEAARLQVERILVNGGGQRIRRS